MKKIVRRYQSKFRGNRPAGDMLRVVQGQFEYWADLNADLPLDGTRLYTSGQWHFPFAIRPNWNG